MIYSLIQNHCKFYGIVVKMSPGNCRHPANVCYDVECLYQC